MLRRVALAFLSLLVTTQAWAGVVYHFRTTLTTKYGDTTAGGSVWASGPAYRYEPDPPASPRKAHISSDGEKSTYVLNLDARTFYRQQRPANARSSRIFHIPFADQRIADCPVVKHTREDGGTIAGHATTKHRIEIEYQVQAALEGSVVTATIRAVATTWAAEDLPPLPMSRDLRTGFDAIDRELARANAEIDGMPLRSELEVSRRYTGGEPEVEHTKTIVDRLDIAPIDPVVFLVPPDFAVETLTPPQPEPAKRRRAQR